MSSIYITIDGKPVLDPRELYSSAIRNGTSTFFWGKANGFASSFGRDPGVGWILVSEDVLNSIGINGTHSIKFVDGVNKAEQEITNLTIARVLNMSGRSNVANSGRAFLLELHDIRTHLFTYPCNVRYNYRIGEEDAGTLSDGQFNTDTADGTNDPYSGKEILDDLWANHMPSYTPTLTSVGSVFNSVSNIPNNLRLYGLPSTWEVINDLCAMDFYFFHMDPGGANQITLQFNNNGSLTNFWYDSLEAHAGRLIYDWDPGIPVRVNLPETIRTFYPAVYEWVGPGQSLPAFEFDTAITALPSYSTHVSQEDWFQTSFILPGTVHSVWGYEVAYYDDDDSHINTSVASTGVASAELLRLAYNRMRARRHYSGIFPWNKTSTATPYIWQTQTGWSTIRWRDYGSGLVTELISGTFVDRPRLLTYDWFLNRALTWEGGHVEGTLDGNLNSGGRSTLRIEAGSTTPSTATINGTNIPAGMKVASGAAVTAYWNRQARAYNFIASSTAFSAI